jgi:ABC-type multidrug transport system ATPase subunit
MLLRKLANSGQAILCTLHQPSSQLFQLFDRLLLLGKGGEQLYFGDIGPTASTVVRYFESNGNFRYPKHSNPAEWIMEITHNSSVGEEEENSPQHHNPWGNIWSLSNQKKELVERLDQLVAKPPQTTTLAATLTDNGTEYASSFLSQFRLVIERAFQNYWRSPVLLYSKMFLCLGIVSYVT